MAKVDPKAPVTNEYLDGAVRAIEGLLNKVLEKQEEHDKRFDEAAAERQDLKRQIGSFTGNLIWLWDGIMVS